MARNACPRLVSILFLLAQNWGICKRRYDRFEKRQARAGALAEPEDDEEDRAVSDAFRDHPFPGFVRWVSRHTGEDQDAICAAALKEFNGEPAIVAKLNELDDKGVTAELFAKLRGECPEIVDRLFANKKDAAASAGPAASPLADLLDRAGRVFGTAWTLGQELMRDHNSQGPVVMAGVQPPAGQRHGERIKEFVEATLSVRDIVQNPPDGLDDVVKQLCEAGKYAKLLDSRVKVRANDWDILELWPNLNQVGHDGYEAVKAACAATRQDDPFAAFDEPKPGLRDQHATKASPKEAAEETPTPKKPKRSTEKGEGQAKLIAALTKHHKYADDGCLNLEPIGNNELARQAGVNQATASAFFKQQFKGHSKYKATCADVSRLTAALKLLNGEFAPHLLYGAKPPNEDERGDE